MNYKWHYEAPDAATAATGASLASELGIHPALAGLLCERGIHTPQPERSV